ncbi:dihydroxyacetone kinase subunit DhaK [Entomobacter blattae]|uniref:PTS-dependent dihydroxyacetone kinase 2, dihydroxyacetone-binding subunit DhaK n=1 Tax=Entomobacter blattae TaxID=2762277 RepID=A0A7H1NTW6_9PROT|nr:dihydroxyacetone kinase subunit DhaK [Entomobacter blattae]QNT79226.1 PTS-dependent dihydroxyacetone kinase 2, dihydroxyacetone-binding subunit DhaK [Entomobacter blattae]
MKRIVNDPDRLVEDGIEGYLAAYPQFYEKTENPRTLKRPQAPVKGKVGVVTGGGSGHEPAFLGYVGEGLLDAVAIGEVFSSPTAGAFLDAIKAAESGAGVVCLYGNYAGDNMNVKMAIKKAKAANIAVKTVMANDDVASAPKTEREKRRGVAGEILMWKVGGAAAAMGYDLDGVAQISQKAIDMCRSIGVGLSACTIPAVGKPNFTIADGKMEIGIGHHGEPGVDITDWKPAHETAKIMLEHVVEDKPFERGEEVVVLVSGLGSTPVIELYVYYAEIAKLLKEKGIIVHKCYVGNYFTSLDMMGVTLTIMGLDEELKKMVDYPVNSLALVQK